MDPIQPPQPFQFKFGQNYGDWTKYAGLDRNTGMFAVAPPQNSLSNAPSFTETAKKFTETVNDLTSGNFFKPSTPKAPVAPGTTPTATQPQSGVYNYDSNWE